MLFTHQDIRARLRQRPFNPLRIVTTTGETFDVFHPDLVFVGRRFIEVGLPAPDEPTFFDQITRVALAHITELRDLPVPATPTNGPPA